MSNKDKNNSSDAPAKAEILNSTDATAGADVPVVAETEVRHESLGRSNELSSSQDPSGGDSPLNDEVGMGNSAVKNGDTDLESTKTKKVKEGPKYWIGFDLGGTKMQCALFNDKLKKVCQQKRRTRQELGVEGGLERIADTIVRTLKEAQLEPNQLAGIGIGCPGPVEWDTGIVRVAVNLGWQNVKVGAILSKRFGCPVEVINDVDAGVYGEHVAGAGVGARTTFGIFPGTGVGGGCVYDGQILRGKHLSCMEIGHIKIFGSPRQGGSNMTGSLESEASRLALAGELAKLAFRGEAPNLYKAVGTDIAEIRSKVIYEAIAAGDKQVEKAMMMVCEAIGHSVANIVLLLCPDCIVLGGGMIDAMPDRFLKHISSVAKSSVFECYRDQFELRVAKLGDDAGVVGCAAWVAKVVSQRMAF